jgi:single-stranded-DNA-specific exonuclease
LNADVVYHCAHINAAGRIKHGNHAVELLTEFNFEQAQQFASEQYNSDRKDLDKQTKEAFSNEENQEQERYTSVVYKELAQGVIGIVASS